MRFSSRLPPELHPNALTRLLQQKRHAGAHIVDLTESNPTHAGIEYPPGFLASLAVVAGFLWAVVAPRPLLVMTGHGTAAVIHAETSAFIGFAAPNCDRTAALAWPPPTAETTEFWNEEPVLPSEAGWVATIAAPTGANALVMSTAPRP